MRTFEQGKRYGENAVKYTATCYSATDAVNILREYLQLCAPRNKEDGTARQQMTMPNNSVIKNGELKQTRQRKEK